ncbi:Leucine-rich repeat extensin-like protein 4 [Hibiscus syriacus]|uniref:Cell wall hydroxyproline-rich glycoprotein n=1 Tax=Hibiscus syriacus TaxID=106335 RepID=A0A6A2XR38_HIBSY|nr:leucine-rich repeat extensin-like protein 6 [Hibiscus syriacus]KAE8660869.1 Leucine-rich repeat extensin-like protein 4 [Hibiscus syriacus]
MEKTTYLSSFLEVILTVIFLSSTPSYALVDTGINPPLIPKSRLLNAYIALKAWKHAMISDPNGFASNWYGPNVCNYTGVFCAQATDDAYATVVAGIDLNHANIAGSLPDELGLLTDLALFHINSNRFYGTLPQSFRKLNLLYELDVSNNRFSGEFPHVVLYLTSLKFLDIRFNEFSGRIPSQLFDLKLDALFFNDNKFQSLIPDNFGNSPASVIVMANNGLSGCFPSSSLVKMAGTLREIVLMNNEFTGCLRPEIGALKGLTVFDVRSNKLVGPLPDAIGEMKSLELLNVANNKLSGYIPQSICSLPNLKNFTFSNNFFISEPSKCLELRAKDDRKNCIPYRPLQNSPMDCKSFYAHPVDCSVSGCSPPPLPPPVHHWP